MDEQNYCDKLEYLWKVQEAFNDKFFQKKLNKLTSELTFEERIQWSKNQILSIVKEATEVLDELPNWKEHRKENSDFIISNLIEEIIDVNKFAIGLAQIWNIGVNTYYDEYLRKSWVVDQRWAQEQELGAISKKAKVVGIDIDGVLGSYPEWFLTYLKTIHNLSFDTIHDAKTVLPVERYEALKALYRQSGWKANMPSNQYASELTHKLREYGYTIIILTSRPYKKYSRIYPDTLQFLKINKIVYDAIIWDDQKHLKIITEFPNMQFMIEDNPEICQSIADAGYIVYRHVTSEFQNMAFDKHPNIKIIKSLKEVIDDLS